MSFLTGPRASGIESLLRQCCCKARSTMPADLTATANYQVMNRDRLGIAPGKAERAAWRATEAFRFNLEAGFVLLATVRPG